jgi:hypothetical protein
VHGSGAAHGGNPFSGSQPSGVHLIAHGSGFPFGAHSSVHDSNFLNTGHPSNVSYVGQVFGGAFY